MIEFRQWLSLTVPQFCFRELQNENAINTDSILFLLKIIEQDLDMAKAEQDSKKHGNTFIWRSREFKSNMFIRNTNKINACNQIEFNQFY